MLHLKMSFELFSEGENDAGPRGYPFVAHAQKRWHFMKAEKFE